MAGISAGGIMSGLDTESIIKQLMAIDRRPVTLLEQKNKLYQDQLSSLGKVKSSLSKLQDSLKALSDPLKLMALGGSSSDEAVGKVSVTSSKAAAGKYQLNVTQLATQDKLLSGGFAKDATFSGTMKIEVGGKSADIELKAGATLEDVRDAINKGDAGVSASIVQNGGKYQLLLSSNETGANQKINISGVAGLSTDKFEVKQSAGNAKFSLDGIDFERASNSIDDAMLGLKFELGKVGTASLEVKPNTADMGKLLDEFVNAYNGLRDTIKAETASDPKAQTKKPLSGDSTVSGIMGQLRGVFSEGFGGKHGFDIGLEFDKDGKLKLDKTKMDKALQDDPAAVANFFTQVDSSGNKTGLAVSLNGKVDAMLKSNGLFANKEEAINRGIKDVDKQKEQMELRLAQNEKRYRAQFVALESISAQMNSLNSFLTQQLSRM